MTELIARRSFIAGLLAAPFIVKAASLDMVRGVVMPIRGFIWGKRTQLWLDEQLGVSGSETLGFAVPYAQFTGQFEVANTAESIVLDKLMAMVEAHKDGPSPYGELQNFPLTMEVAHTGHVRKHDDQYVPWPEPDYVQHGPGLCDQRLVANTAADRAAGISAYDRATGGPAVYVDEAEFAEIERCTHIPQQPTESIRKGADLIRALYKNC
jgi:hypothetical protein